VSHGLLGEIYARYGRTVLRRAHQLLGDAEAAQDILQEVFVRVLRLGGDLPRDPTPTAWLYRVTTNLCLNRLRDQSRREALLSRRYTLGTALPAGESRALVKQILQHIPEDLQDIAVFYFVDELTQEEIASLLGVSPRTISNRLADFRALVADVSAERRSAS